MRLPASAWFSVGVLVVTIVGGIALSKQQSHKKYGVVLPSLRTSLPTQAVVEGDETRLIRLEISSGPSIPEVESIAESHLVEKAPALAAAIETRIRLRGNLQISDSQAIDLLVSREENRASWVAAIEKWACGTSTGLALYFPKWSIDRQLMSANTESGGMGIGLQYKATF